MSVQERLKIIRQHLNKTQKQMSAFLKMGETTWQNYERGINIPGAETLQRLCEKGFNAQWILTGKGMVQTSSKEDEKKDPEFMESKEVFSAAYPDEELFIQVLQAFEELYHDLQKTSKNHELERLAFREAFNIAQASTDPKEQMTMVKLAITQKRRQLLKID